MNHKNESLYDKAQSAVQFNGRTEDWFRTTVAVRHGCPLSPTLFLERIMCKALDDHEGSIGGRHITNFRFADDVVNAKEEDEAGVLIHRLDTTT